MTKDELVKKLYPGIAYDTALPQPYVNACQKIGFDIRPCMIWAYPKESPYVGTPYPLTKEAENFLLSNGNEKTWPDIVYPLSPKDYQIALDAKSACNLSDLVHSLAEVMPQIVKECSGTQEWNEHPIVRLYVEQMIRLSCKRDYSEAYQICEEKSRG